MITRYPWLLPAAGAAIAIASCSVYDTSLLLGLGGSNSGGGSSSVTSAATSSSSGAGGAGGRSATSNGGGSGGTSTTSNGGGGAGGMASTSASSSSSSTTSASSSSGGGCTDGSQCPGPTTDCQSPSCAGGVCKTAYAPEGTPTAAQTAGDCQEVVCDGEGGTTSTPDETDVPAPTSDCATGTCTNGVPGLPAMPAGSACASSGGKLCDGAGNCVQCLMASDCASLVCSAASTCLAPSCSDHVRNGNETDVDCGGGTCPPCALGKDCQASADCTSLDCASGVCVSSCSDRVQDGQETDVDCGGPVCAGCAVGKKCLAGTDCGSGRCSSGTCVDGLLISQIQTRGINGGSDEWVELYNPGSAPVTFDSTWSFDARSATGGCVTGSYTTRFSGAGQIIPAHGHILYANSFGFSESTTTPADGTYPTNYGITDAASVLLEHGGAVVDALCFYYDTTTLATLTMCSAYPYTCSGTPVQNPHDNTTATDQDQSLERKPGGSGGNTQSTGVNASDFSSNPAPDPHDLASPPTP